MDKHFAPRIYVLHRYASPRSGQQQKKRHRILVAVSSLYHRFRKKSIGVRLGQLLLILFAAWHVFILLCLILSPFTK